MTKAPATASGDGVLKNDFRQHLARTCPEQDLRRWFDPLEILPGEGDQTCCVVFPHAYFAAWFDASAKELFERQLAAYLGPGHTVRYRTRGVRAAAPAFAADAAVVLNLTQDHLDWHGDMVSYAAAKARIFGGTGTRVVNADDLSLIHISQGIVR